MIARKHPFSGMGPNKEDLNLVQIITKVVVEKIRPGIPECHPSLKTLIEECWRDDPDTRPTVDEIIKRLESIGWLKGFLYLYLSITT